MTIRHNTSALNSLRHSGENYNKVKNTIEKLTSGMSVNKAADGPASLIASERLRGQIVGVRQALDNAEASVSMIQVVEGALNEISGHLVNMRQIAVHAANEAINDSQMLEADQSEMENLLVSLDRIARHTEFSGRKLLDGSNGTGGTSVGEGIRFVSATPATQASPDTGFSVDITQVATRAKLSGTKPINVENIGNLSIVVNEGGKIAILDTTQGKISETIGRIVDNTRENPKRFPPEQASQDIRELVVTNLQKEIDEIGLNVDVFTDQNNMLTVRHREFGSHTSLSMTSSVAGVLSEEAGIASNAKDGQDVEGTIGGEIALGKGQMLSGVDGTPIEGLTIEYSKTLGTKEIPINDENGIQVGVQYLDESNEDVVGSPDDPKVEGFVHVSQRSLAFHIGPKDSQKASLAFANVRTNNLAKGYANKSGFDSLADLDLRTTQGARDAINMIDDAIDQVSKVRAEMGSFQKNALESNLNNLRVTEENLTQAESTIRDADMAKEMSKLTSGQMMLSASTAILSQANQVPNSVLELITKG